MRLAFVECWIVCCVEAMLYFVPANQRATQHKHTKHDFSTMGRYTGEWAKVLYAKVGLVTIGSLLRTKETAENDRTNSTRQRGEPL